MPHDEHASGVHVLGISERGHRGHRVVSDDGVERIVLGGYLVFVEALLVPERGDTFAGEPPREVFEDFRCASGPVGVVNPVPVNQHDARERPVSCGHREHAVQFYVPGVDRYVSLTERVTFDIVGASYPGENERAATPPPSTSTLATSLPSA